LKISTARIDRLAGVQPNEVCLPLEVIDDLRRLVAAADKR
jgi:hypothetical protein